MKADTKKPREDYPVQTGQEANAMLAAVADGKSGRHWQTLIGAGSRVHKTPGASHYVSLRLSDGERELNIAVEALESATLKCDADDDFILLYISRLLTPSHPLPAGAFAGATIKLDDVIKAIGWNPQTTVQRAEMRRRIWQFIKFASRAHIIGQRNYKQKDKLTGKELDTYIDSPPFMIGDTVREKPPEPSLFDDDEPPISVRIAASDAWTRLTAMPDTAQFLPLGEVLGAIPGAKPSGAWARVVGLALANFWRRNPRDAMSGKLKPTRRELLERYTPSTGSVADVLASNDPGRAVQYWAAALRILVESEFLADEGESALTAEEMRAALPRYDWAELWLSGKPDLKPGAALLAAVQERADALPQPKPKRKKQQKTAAR
jgi:hypothetical protein